MAEKITVNVSINAPISKVWDAYNDPDQVTKWNHASEDWHSPSASNDLTVGGRFSYRMEAKDESAGFDFEGTYTEIEDQRLIKYTMDDDREVEVVFEGDEEKTDITVTFDAESENELDVQKDGWQAILDNFKKYVEAD